MTKYLQNQWHFHQPRLYFVCVVNMLNIILQFHLADAFLKSDIYTC